MFFHSYAMSDCINHVMQFPKGDVPQWVRNAMEVAGIDISECCASAKCHAPSIQEQPLTIPVPVDADGVVQQN
jgi:queuine tRNA-ribosyltransferase catalytic subunit